MGPLWNELIPQNRVQHVRYSSKDRQGKIDEVEFRRRGDDLKRGRGQLVAFEVILDRHEIELVAADLEKARNILQGREIEMEEAVALCEEHNLHPDVAKEIAPEKKMGFLGF